MGLNRLVWGIVLFVILGVIFFPVIFNYSERKSDKVYEEVVLTDTTKVREKPTYITAKSRPKNVIFMIGDGMGLTQITAGMIVKKDALALEKFRHIGIIKTFSNKLITDSAAGATAMATGEKTYNGAIAVSLKVQPLKTILEYAEENSWATGIVTTSTVTHATPASFYGHQEKRSNVNLPLAKECMEQGMEVIAGGGKSYFQGRPDGIDLIAQAQEDGYYYIDSIDLLGDYKPKKLLCLISPEQPERRSIRGDFLPKATKTAVEVLHSNKAKGFFLMVEGAQIDWGGHSNKSDHIIEEMIDFDEAVAHALAFAEKDGNTLVVVTADHETGGYAISGGDLKKKEVTGTFTTDYHTATMVPVFAFGPGAESFAGVYDNTEIFFKLKHLMNME